MRKVSVNCSLTYAVILEVPEDLQGTELMTHCDIEDPAFPELCKTVAKFTHSFDGAIISIVDDDTGEVLYTE